MSQLRPKEIVEQIVIFWGVRRLFPLGVPMKGGELRKNALHTFLLNAVLKGG
jgi:hypothetical protein